MPHNGSVCVAVTGLNSLDSPAPGIPVMRCIQEAANGKVQGIGLGYDTLDAGMYERMNFKHVYLLPYPSEGADCLLDRLLVIHKRTPLRVIIPTLDSEMFNFITIEERLNQLGIAAVVPTKEQLRLSAKNSIGDLEKKGNIPILPYRVVAEVNKVSKKAEELGFPIMVKGIFYEAYKAANVDDINKHILKISSKWGMPIILQKYMDGDEYNVVALGDGKGEAVGMVCMRKLITTDKGKGWAGVTIHDPHLDQLVFKFFETTHWRGPVELEVLKAKENNTLYLIEVNPRFPAWVYLSKAAGNNLPWMTVKLALGEKVSRSNKYKIGVIFTRYSNEYILNVKQLERLNVKGELHYV
ncbi:MAG: ATP-grasp domain-containing protein [Elusimicrobia bacterium]|nr:ATP-grasp domain-containing protein [Elusimicrobiota bacterium]